MSEVPQRSTSLPDGAVLRRAAAVDAPALVELRAAMFATMGQRTEAGAPWREGAAAWFTDHLDLDACAYLVEAAGVPVAAAVGYVHSAPPSPRSLTGVRGHVSNVITVEDHRRRGYARACVQALVSWFDHETPAERVDLAASEDGLALYQSLGWVRRPQPTLSLTLARRPQ